MRYAIQFRPRAWRDMKNLSPEVSRRIEAKIETLADGLSGDVKRLVDYSPGWRLRVGDWRVLFELLGDSIVIHRVVHRSQAYR